MKKSYIVSTIVLLLFAAIAKAQMPDTVQVFLRANVKQDAIQLRWAVNSSSSWFYTNKNGFRVERSCIVREGEVLAEPEILVWHEQLKARPLDDWQHIAQRDNFAALIAQALYGSDFEVSGGKAGIAEIIAASQEQQQRYALSLYAADMSYEAALFAGWGFTDTTVVAGERYLYRISPVMLPDSKKTPISGTAYVGLEDYMPLPRPIDLSANFGNASVLLTWDYDILSDTYSAYYVERSEDNRHFKRLSDLPLTNIEGEGRMFYSDSIENKKDYYYRIVGLTPFGKLSEPSDTIQGQALPMLIYVPNITTVEADEKGGIYLSWDFDEAGNKDVSHFELQRSETHNGMFTTEVKDIAPSERKLYYAKPMPVNYLRIAAISHFGDATYSFPRLYQMIDSIPPAIPTGLEGYVDTVGFVHLKWTANTDEDIYGYRIYRAQTKGEELIPMTDIAIKENFYLDSISVHNLNPKVYYAIAALDKRYNQSKPCEAIEISKPVMITPAPPYITNYESTEEGIRITWVNNEDETLESFIVHRSEGSQKAKEIHRQSAKDETSYLDPDVVAGVSYRYEIIAENTGKKLSNPSPSIQVKAQAKALTKADLIKKFTAQRTNNGILLKWVQHLQDIKSARIYRKEGDGAMILWKELSLWDSEITDNSAKQNTAYEYMLVYRDRNGRPITKTVKIE